MAALGWLLNLGLAGGTAGAALETSDDLTTLFTWYVEDLHDANLTEEDSNTLVINDLPTVRAAAAASDLDDLNTLYWMHLHG